MLMGMLVIHTLLVPLVFVGILLILQQDYQSQFINNARSQSYLLATLIVRFLGKALAILVFGRLSGVRPGGAGLLAIALLPMSGLAVGMVRDTSALFPTFGAFCR